jgi:hypothetical protein
MTNFRKYDSPLLYRIKVCGSLEPKWSSWFGECKLTPQNGETILICQVTDQAALYGLLARIGSLGLPLLEVKCLERSLKNEK